MSRTGAVPTAQFGVRTSKNSSKVDNFPVLKPQEGEILIQNVAVASNPKDWKYPKEDDGYIEGNDVAGTVIEVGPGVTVYKNGDKVAAFTKMATKMDKYSVSPASSAFPIPGNISFEEAATLPLAVMTAAIGLFVRLGLPEPPSPSERSSADVVLKDADGQQEAILIYGASSSVGAYAVQLAKRAGLFVVAIAGASGDYVKSLGADVVIDYRKHKGKEAMAEEIHKSLGSHPCGHAFDAICQHGSTLILAHAVVNHSPEGEGHITYVLDLSDEDKQKLPMGVKACLTYVATAHGDDEEFAKRFYRKISDFLVPSANNPNPLKPNKVKVVPDGLAGVEHGLKLLKGGHVHAEKLVYRVADTPKQ